MHRVVQQALLGGLELGDVGERADEAHHLAVRADHGPRLEREPEIVAVRRAQPEVLHQPAAALLEHAVERGAEAVAVVRVQHVEPARRRAFERAALEAEQLLGLGAGEDRSAETSQSQIMSPAPVSASARRSTSETMLWVMPPANACCMTVKPISMTISTRPPSSAGPMMSLVTSR